MARHSSDDEHVWVHYPNYQRMQQSSHLPTEIQRLQAKRNHGYRWHGRAKVFYALLCKGKNCCELQSWMLILP